MFTIHGPLEPSSLRVRLFLNKVQRMLFNSQSLRILSLSLVIFFFCNVSYAGCDDDAISVHCGKTPTSVFDTKGRLWVAFVQQQHVYVTYSDNLAETFAPAVLVNQTSQSIYSNGENRPKIAISTEGHVYVSWTEKTKGRFNGDIHFARSIDGGQHFEKDIIVNDDGKPIGHRFDSLLLTPSGDVYLAWLDKRLSTSAKKAGLPYEGISLYYSLSKDHGKTFSSNQLAAEHTCECCRIAIAPSGQHDAVIMWRHIFEGSLRDHAITLLTQDKTPVVQRATIDQWQTNACPHHGPSISAITHHQYHMTWFSNGSLNKGLYYARYHLQTKKSSPPILIDDSPSASHPFVKQVDDTTWLVWKSFIQGRTKIFAQYSKDQGQQWSHPTVIAETAKASDHPFIIHNGPNVYASWFTANEGLRLLPLQP